MAREIKGKRQKLADAIIEHYTPEIENETMRKVKAIMYHNLTCGDLSHGHGIVKVKWEKTNHADNQKADL